MSLTPSKAYELWFEPRFTSQELLWTIAISVVRSFEHRSCYVCLNLRRLFCHILMMSGEAGVHVKRMALRIQNERLQTGRVTDALTEF